MIRARIREVMKNFQIRLADEVYEAIKELAGERKTSIADVIRESLELYAIQSTYAREGRRLMWEDEETGDRTEVLIPGFTMRRFRAREQAREHAAAGTSGTRK
jgi:hypothetical protein